VDAQPTTPYTRFIILGDARTGSNLLANALNSHPQIVCFREIFHFAHEDLIDWDVTGFDPRDPEDIAMRAADPVRFMRARVFGQFAPDVRAVGFKYLYGHFWGFKGLSDALAGDMDLRVVHLLRRNLLRLFVSLRIAEETGRWLDPAPPPLGRRIASFVRHPVRNMRGTEVVAPERPERRPLALTTEECLQFFAKHRAERQRYGEMFSHHRLLTMHYEDLLHDQHRVFGDVQQFVGVEPRTLHTNLRRQNPEPLHELIANYDEFSGAARDTEIARFLDEEQRVPAQPERERLRRHGRDLGDGRGVSNI
jgi:LPS sulfotransferase NodH